MQLAPMSLCLDWSYENWDDGDEHDDHHQNKDLWSWQKEKFIRTYSMTDKDSYSYCYSSLFEHCHWNNWITVALGNAKVSMIL